VQLLKLLVLEFSPNIFAKPCGYNICTAFLLLIFGEIKFMVQLSIVLFFGLFAVVEIYQSVKNVQLPMPVYLVLGIILAIASNASGRFQNLSNSEVAVAPELTTIQAQDQKQIVSSVD
jgi:hypothetical protein